MGFQEVSEMVISADPDFLDVFLGPFVHRYRLDLAEVKSQQTVLARTLDTNPNAVGDGNPLRVKFTALLRDINWD